MLAALWQGQGVDVWEAVLHSSPMAKGVLVLLAIFSTVSWVIIFQKAVLLKRCRRASDTFRSAFRRSTDWRDLKHASAKSTMSPLFGLFTAGYTEVTYQLRLSQPGAKAQVKSMEAVERSLQRSSVVEMGRMERYLGILATIAAVSPFVGLFGTVWGIIDAFRSIGLTGNASLVTVGPGIADALVATAVGLMAAVPALMAYNFFQGHLKQWQTELDDFALEFISLCERNFT